MDFFFLVISAKNGVGVISFSSVVQEHMMRRSLHFVAKRKSKKVFGRVKGRTDGAVSLQKRVSWGKKNEENYVSISLKFI